MPEDYIMRLTAQIAAILAAIMGKRNDGKITDARQDLEKLAARWTVAARWTGSDHHISHFWIILIMDWS